MSARAPSPSELREAAPVLARAYGDPANAAMMGHADDDAFEASDVVEHYEELEREGGIGFLLYENDAFVGDADLREVDREASHAEVAIMLLPQGTKSRGLGTRFASMIHAYAFRALELDRVYAAILPSNVASQRLFERIGHQRDDSAAARALVDEDDELTYSIDRETFERMHADALATAEITR